MRSHLKRQDNPRRYLVILADRKKAKFFTIYLGTFEDQGEEIIDEIPQKVRVEHTRPGKVQKHIQDHLNKHLKLVGQKALEYLVKSRRGVSGVAIGGHKELLSKIQEFLPPKLKNKVIFEFVTDMDVPIGNLTKKIISEIKEVKGEESDSII